jgi:hypothetical protein
LPSALGSMPGNPKKRRVNQPPARSAWGLHTNSLSRSTQGAMPTTPGQSERVFRACAAPDSMRCGQFHEPIASNPPCRRDGSEAARDLNNYWCPGPYHPLTAPRSPCHPLTWSPCHPLACHPSSPSAHARQFPGGLRRLGSSRCATGGQIGWRIPSPGSGTKVGLVAHVFWIPHAHTSGKDGRSRRKKFFGPLSITWPLRIRLEADGKDCDLGP